MREHLLKRRNDPVDLFIRDQIDIGYLFYPPCHPDHPCHLRLDVFLRKDTTLRHFDPKKVRFNVKSKLGGADTLSVQYPWVGRERYQVIASCVRIQDREGKTVEAFTFGGDLAISKKADTTHCTLRSPVPILRMDSSSSVSSTFAREVKILLAQRRAKWEMGHKDSDFDNILAKIEPRILYHVCLETLHLKFKHFSTGELDALQRFTNFLWNELRIRKRGMMFRYIPSIDRLL